MALSDLISRLEQEAQSQVQAIEQTADAEVRAIEAATERAAADASAHHLRREHAERQAVQQRELALARRQAHARELEARHGQLVRILDRAHALIPELGASAPYIEALPWHLQEAMSFLEGLPSRVRCQAAFAPMLQKTLAQYAGAVLVIDETVGPGVVVEAADGSVTVDNTLAGRLARAQAGLAIELVTALTDGRP
jgi:vacuolar-type H+-ATPase subunit E/Vma4